MKQKIKFNWNAYLWMLIVNFIYNVVSYYDMSVLGFCILQFLFTIILFLIFIIGTSVWYDIKELRK